MGGSCFQPFTWCQSTPDWGIPIVLAYGRWCSLLLGNSAGTCTRNLLLTFLWGLPFICSQHGIWMLKWNNLMVDILRNLCRSCKLFFFSFFKSWSIIFVAIYWVEYQLRCPSHWEVNTGRCSSVADPSGSWWSSFFPSAKYTHPLPRLPKFYLIMSPRSGWKSRIS